MSKPLHPGELAEIKDFVVDLKLPDDATPFEKTLYATVKKDMALLVAEIERLQGEVVAEREDCAALATTYVDTHGVYIGPGGDCGQGCQGIAEEIVAAIRARGEKT